MVKTLKHDKIIVRIESQMQPVQPEERITEAARKVLQAEFVQMLQREQGSRGGEDIEDVHKMRVAIRQTRSMFHLLDSYFKSKVIRELDRELRKVMRALGKVRDLDVMIADLNGHNLDLSAEEQASLDNVIYALDQRRSVARDALIERLDSKAYRRFVSDYESFLLTPYAGVAKVKSGTVTPIELRHVLPPMIYTHLAEVRAYDSLLADAEVETLHALRIRFKRLRYAVSLFAPVLGKDITVFIDELKTIQDHLGRLNDIHIASLALNDLMADLEPDQNAVLRMYVDALASEKPDLIAAFPAQWRHFNSKSVQRKLANAVLVL